MDSNFEPDITINGKSFNTDNLDKIPSSPRKLRRGFTENIKNNPINEDILNSNDLFESIKRVENQKKKKQKEEEDSKFNRLNEIDRQIDEITNELNSNDNIKLTVNESELENENNNLIKKFSIKELNIILKNIIIERDGIHSDLLLSIRDSRKTQYERRVDIKQKINYKYIFVKRIELTEEQKTVNLDRIFKTLELYSKKYKSIQIPKYDRETDYDRLLLITDYVKQQIDHRKKIGKYKLLLGAFFMGIELFIIYVLEFKDVKFVESQLQKMDQYELILNEWSNDKEVEQVMKRVSSFTSIFKVMGQNFGVFFVAKIIGKLFNRDTTEIEKMISTFLQGKTIEDLNVEDGEEETMISSLYNIGKTLLSMYMGNKTKI